LGTHRLIPHPDTPPRGIERVDVRWFEAAERLILRYQVTGVDALCVPAFGGKGRGDELWQTTCFELFLRDAEGYREFNFSPSERWAAYRFGGYRDGRSDTELEAPEIGPSAGEHLFILTASLNARIVAGATAAGLAAVIEEKDGTKSYWALAHAAGQPDFHDPACFALPLPAAG
jgi:hypothetical protein